MRTRWPLSHRHLKCALKNINKAINKPNYSKFRRMTVKPDWETQRCDGCRGPCHRVPAPPEALAPAALWPPTIIHTFRHPRTLEEQTERGCRLQALVR